MSPASTLGALRRDGYRSRTIKQELREHLVTKLRNQEVAFPGIVGFDETELPQRESARLAGHDRSLLGGRGQGKAGRMRTLAARVAEWMPVGEGCESNGGPGAPVWSRCVRMAEALGDDLPVA